MSLLLSSPPGGLRNPRSPMGRAIRLTRRAGVAVGLVGAALASAASAQAAATHAPAANHAPTSSFGRHHGSKTGKQWKLVSHSAAIGATAALSSTGSSSSRMNAGAPRLTANAATQLTGLTWNGDLSTGTFSQGWVTSPLHPGLSHSLEITVAQNSVTANCGVLGSPGHPNGQILSPPLFKPGDNAYIGFSEYLPANFPSICTPYVLGCFFSFAEVYGPPYLGSPPFGLEFIGRHFFLGTRANSDAWNSPNVANGMWNDFVLHVNFATDNSGYIELWFNGVQQTFANGSTRLYEATLMPGVNWNGTTPDHLSLQEYRGAAPSYGTLSTFNTGARIGTTYASVSGM
jgi:hypothetical protein